MDYIDKYDELIELLTEEIEIDDKKYYLKEEFDKFFVKGNKTAGIRIRKIMQKIKKTAQGVRDDVQSYKKSI